MSGELTIGDLVEIGNAGHLAISDVRGDGLTYGELRNLIARTHTVLAEYGLRGADTIAYSLPNGPETAALFLSLATFGRVAPLNPNYTTKEIAFLLGDLGARALVMRPQHQAAAEAARQAGVTPILLEPAGPSAIGAFRLRAETGATRGVPTKRPDPGDVALLLHTSGTTARPKLVPLTQRHLCLSSAAVRDVLGLTASDRSLSVTPLFHIHGLVAGVLASIAAGGAICCPPGFQATSFFSWLDSSQATWYSAVPTMHQAILLRARTNAPILSRHKLRLIRSSSSPLFPTVWDQLETTFRVPVLNAYGMTEAAHQITSVRLDGGTRFNGGTRFRGSVGFTSGPEIAILDDAGALLPSGAVGEVALRGAQIMAGYLHPQGANEKAFVDGWFRTGDEGYLDADGVLRLCGRIKEMINSGGEKVSPYEVEEAILGHPAVAQAVAFAAPHALLGEEVAAAVVIHEGCRLSDRELLASIGTRLARFKLPRRVIFVTELPGGATGKLQRLGLAARFGLTSAAV